MLRVKRADLGKGSADTTQLKEGLSASLPATRRAPLPCPPCPARCRAPCAAIMKLFWMRHLLTITRLRRLAAKPGGMSFSGFARGAAVGRVPADAGSVRPLQPGRDYAAHPLEALPPRCWRRGRHRSGPGGIDDGAAGAGQKHLRTRTKGRGTTWSREGAGGQQSQREDGPSGNLHRCRYRRHSFPPPFEYAAGEALCHLFAPC